MSEKEKSVPHIRVGSLGEHLEDGGVRVRTGSFIYHIPGQYPIESTTAIPNDVLEDLALAASALQETNQAPPIPRVTYSATVTIRFPYSPPRWMQFLYRVLTPPKNREMIEGDLREGYDKTATQYGTCAANIELAHDLASLLWPRVRGLFKMLLKLIMLRWIAG